MSEPNVTINRESYERVLIGGNHLASGLISCGCWPNEQRDYAQVLQEHGFLCADMWIAWKAVMDLPDLDP